MSYVYDAVKQIGHVREDTFKWDKETVHDVR